MLENQKYSLDKNNILLGYGAYGIRLYLMMDILVHFSLQVVINMFTVKYKRELLQIASNKHQKYSLTLHSLSLRSWNQLITKKKK